MKKFARTRRTAQRIRTALTPSATAWRGAGAGVYVVGTIAMVALFATYFLTPFAWQKLPAYAVWISISIAIGFAGLLAAAAVMRLPVNYRIPLAMFVPFLVIFVFPGGPLTGVLGAIVLLAVFSLAGAGIAVLRQEGRQPARRRAAITALAVGGAGLFVGLFTIFSDKPPANPLLVDYVLENRTLDLPNPGLPGDFPVLTLSYGSGEDRHREAFGEAVDLVSRHVDASRLIDNWDGLSGWLRTSYWGFDDSALPLQARVWFPEGPGPFPLVLVVHGNHGMEDYSDPGYAYLGELFASRGFILASVDENYLNSSLSSRVEFFADRPGLKEENDARGWLLLQHLALWRDWNKQAGHPFFNKVDIDRVALIGHSRGGEAVGVAAAFNRLDRYPDDASVDFDFDFNLRGVIAIAPVYGQYEPRERPTPVRDVNYFTIHGDMDGDVQSFEGMAQYSRVALSGESFRFRSGLYVVGANHGQFNTTWENLDTGLFEAWALDLSRIMDGEAQRDVARVYFSAFLEVVLRDREEYLPIFRDARYAADWLPPTFYINQFAGSYYRPIADFEDDIDPSTLAGGGRITTQNLSKWYETGNELKYDELPTHSVVVAWDDEFSAGTAAITFSPGSPPSGEILTASVSAIDVATLPDDWQESGDTVASAEETSDDEDKEPAPLDWTIRLTDGAGNVASLPASHDSLLYPLVRAVPRRAGFLDDTEATEVLFRHFEWPLADFAATNPAFDPAGISSVSFVFDRASQGAIIIDDISISTR